MDKSLNDLSVCATGGSPWRKKNEFPLKITFVLRVNAHHFEAGDEVRTQRGHEGKLNHLQAPTEKQPRANIFAPETDTENSDTPSKTPVITSQDT